MLARFFACSLITLILLPFTAPFSTYELASEFGHAREHAMPFPRRATSSVSIDTAVALLPVRVTTGRTRPVAVVSPRFAHSTPTSVAGFTLPLHSRMQPQRLGALLTILRL